MAKRITIKLKPKVSPSMAQLRERARRYDSQGRRLAIGGAERRSSRARAADAKRLREYRVQWNKAYAELQEAKKLNLAKLSKVGSIRYDLSKRAKIKGQRGYIPLGRRKAFVKAKTFALQQQAKQSLNLVQEQIKQSEAKLLAVKK